MLRELSVAFSSSAPRSGFAEAVEIEVHLANGAYEAAEKTARNLHDMLRKQFGEEDEATLAAASSVGVVLGKRGQHAEAETIHREILRALNRAGIESEVTVTSMGGLANALAERKKHSEARRIRNDAIEMSTRIFGAEHVTTLTLRCSRAWQLSLRGDHTDAVDETRAVLAAYKRVLGEEHRTTMTTKSQLAMCLFSYRKFGEAIELEREVLAAFQRVDPTCADAGLCAQRVDMMLEHAHKSRRAPRR
jgi:tetratricopeptide (TPR) repeat protein